MDARYTRTDFHDGISRYGASLIEACAPLAEVTMVISDEAQLALLPGGIPWARAAAPTSPGRQPSIARQLNRHPPGRGVLPDADHGLGWPGVRAHPHPARPHLLPAPHPAGRPAWPRSGCCGAPSTWRTGRSGSCWTGPTPWHRLRHEPPADVAAPAHQPRDPDRRQRPAAVTAPRDRRRARAVPGLHGLVHGLQERRDTAPRAAGLPRVPPAPAARISPAREAELRRVAAEVRVPDEAVVFHRGTT